MPHAVNCMECPYNAFKRELERLTESRHLASCAVTRAPYEVQYSPLYPMLLTALATATTSYSIVVSLMPSSVSAPVKGPK